MKQEIGVFVTETFYLKVAVTGKKLLLFIISM